MKAKYPMFIFFLAGFLLGLPCLTFRAIATEAPSAKAGPPALKAEWDKLVAAAQKEGLVNIYGNVPPKVRENIAPAFRAKYKINVEFVPGRPAEIVAKLQQERNAGLNLMDIGFFGGTTVINDLAPMEICQPLEPMLLLPEVKDPKNWRGGQLPFLDKGKTALIMVMMANSFYQRNVNLVKENEITSSLDLLNPKWKGKMVLNDPSISGASNSWFAWMLTGVLDKEKGLRFMKDLAGQQPVITRDMRQMVEWLAKGKFHISIGPSMTVPANFIQMGAPIAFIDIKEPRSLSPSSGIVNVIKNAPHPNAAKLFLNWVLTKEGSTIFASAYEYPSLRVDVPPKGILPIMVPRPGDVYPEQKFIGFGQLQGEMREVAADVFAPLLK